MNSALIKRAIPESILQRFLKLGDKPVPDFSENITIRAIDIGYGYTKYIKAVNDDGTIETDLFPSLAALAPPEELGGDFFVQRDTKRINNGGTIWEVGPDVFELSSKNDVRALHDNFVTSEQWKVLFMGALAYMDCETIDVLVLGLPVSNMAKKAEMEAQAKGQHLVDGKTYTVKEVLVIPQPLGALYNHAITSNQFERFMSTNSLVIDPGYLTFDFLVTKGFSVNPNRSGARPGGMNAVLTAIAASISTAIGSRYEDLNEIDNALNLKDYSGKKDFRPIFVYGQEVNMTPHIAQTKTVIDTSMNFMINKLGSTMDIAQVIMAGGPNVIFTKSIKEQFPKNEVITLESGIFANVTGFLLWGMLITYGKMLESQKRQDK